MRVLLFEGLDRVTVSDAASGDVLARIDSVPGEGLRVNGGPVVSSWRSRSSGRPFEVRGSKSQQLRVRGSVEVVALYGSEAPGLSGLAVVNEVPLERYLAGTLGREMYGSWGEDALRAQAVASRTYAVHQQRSRREQPWHVTAGTRSQVYGGIADESAPVDAAIEATRGQILVYDDQPILAAFHSSSGGQTASAEEVWGESRDYLVSVPVEDEWDSPDAYWRARVTRGTLGRALALAGNDIGPVVAVEVRRRTRSGRVSRLELVGEGGTVTWTGRRLRSALGESKLKSTLFEVRQDEDGFVFVGSGRGHGVGMSQWGARAMARRGDDYRKILNTFYPGARLTRASGGTR
jgi:stage II sporulation protein D